MTFEKTGSEIPGELFEFMSSSTLIGGEVSRATVTVPEIPMQGVSGRRQVFNHYNKLVTLTLLLFVIHFASFSAYWQT